MTSNQKFALLVYATALFVLLVLGWALIRANNGF